MNLMALISSIHNDEDVIDKDDVCKQYQPRPVGFNLSSFRINYSGIIAPQS
jgi:hypothetical protein